MTGVEQEPIVAPYEPVYTFFDVPGQPFEYLPVVKVHRGPIVWHQETAWDQHRYQIKRQGWKVRHWFKSWWWPARIRVLEARVDELEGWD